MGLPYGLGLADLLRLRLEFRDGVLLPDETRLDEERETVDISDCSGVCIGGGPTTRCCGIGGCRNQYVFRTEPAR